MVQLERIFDLDRIKDQEQQEKKESINSECDTYITGTPNDVKSNFIGKVCTPEEKRGTVDALHTYQDVISWSYEDLKTYDTSIITHTIPFEPATKPFKKERD